jgi:hypothetical protein
VTEQGGLIPGLRYRGKGVATDTGDVPPAVEIRRRLVDDYAT